ncbi:MAG: L-lactate dehydrogenase [Chloroflexota bacterium]|nr:L-lactate dehydrogenase [Chloroflexota bacterium]
MSEDSAQPQPDRVVVVGAGNVGATFAYALLLSGLAAEIVLINRDEDKAEGEAMDLNHTVPFAQPTRIWAGDYGDCAGAAITVITAGANAGPGGGRLDLAEKNGAIFREIVPEIVRHNPGGILLIATNPVDVLTHQSWRLSGLPPGRVIGSGTILDTARFRALLGQHFGVDPRSVHAYIIGEHGNSQVPVWSSANIAGMRLPAFCAAHGLPYDQAAMDRIFEQTRDAAPRIVERKGATYYAVAAGLLRIVEAILRDQHTVLSVSSLIEDYHGIGDIAFSLPSVVGREGVERVLRLDLDDGELDALRRSADVLKEALAPLR